MRGNPNFKFALYQVKADNFEDMDSIKYVQVPFERASINDGDCFIADLGNEFFVWHGSGSNVTEKVKALQIAQQFDADRAGALSPKVFEEGDDEEFMAIFEGWRPKQHMEATQLHAEVFDEEEVKKVDEDENEIVKSPEAEEEEELKAAEAKAKADEEESLQSQADLEKEANDELEQNEEKAEEEMEKPAPPKPAPRACRETSCQTRCTC